MIRTQILSLMCAVALAPGFALAQAATAGVSTIDAPPLASAELTPIGAQRGGNADGSIPPWNGGIKQVPPGFSEGERHIDPYADDPVLFTINADNVEQYADKLSEGQRALLERFPETMYFNIYPTRRSASYPEYVYEGIQVNAKNASLLKEGFGGVVNSVITSPFPVPREGVEVVWNHNMRWRGVRTSRIGGQAAVTRNGNYRVIILQEEFASPYGRPKVSSFSKTHPNTDLGFMQKILAPGSEAGFGQLVLDTHNYVAAQRQSWVYNPNLRRVLRSPLTGFDSPAPQSDGLRLQDESDMFNGSPALFNWKLLGKRELYIPYNSYRLEAEGLEYEDILHKKHANPALLRYELHRVWVVEGTVRSTTHNRRNPDPAKRGHAYSRRVFYIDEDTWQIAVADSYDKDGKLWRTAEGHMMNYYQVPLPWYNMELFYDFKAERYLAKGLDNKFGVTQFSDLISPNDFSPLSLQYFVR
jgi:hypothetical protein